MKECHSDACRVGHRYRHGVYLLGKTGKLHRNTETPSGPGQNQGDIGLSSSKFSCPNQVQRHIHSPFCRAEMLHALALQLRRRPKGKHSTVGGETTPYGIRERQPQRFGFVIYCLSLLLLNGVLSFCSALAIPNGGDDLVNVDLAKQASLPQPAPHFLTDPWDLVVGFTVFAQQPIRCPAASESPVTSPVIVVSSTSSQPLGLRSLVKRSSARWGFGSYVCD